MKIIAARRGLIWESDFVDTESLPLYGLAEKVEKKLKEIEQEVKVAFQRRKRQEQLYKEYQQQSQPQVSQWQKLKDRVKTSIARRS